MGWAVSGALSIKPCKAYLDFRENKTTWLTGHLASIQNNNTAYSTLTLPPDVLILFKMYFVQPVTQLLELDTPVYTCS